MSDRCREIMKITKTASITINIDKITPIFLASSLPPNLTPVIVAYEASEKWAATPPLEWCRATRNRAVDRGEYSPGSRIRDRPARGHDRTESAHVALTQCRILCAVGSDLRQLAAD